MIWSVNPPCLPSIHTPIHLSINPSIHSSIYNIHQYVHSSVSSSKFIYLSSVDPFIRSYIIHQYTHPFMWKSIDLHVRISCLYRSIDWFSTQIFLYVARFIDEGPSMCSSNLKKLFVRGIANGGTRHQPPSYVEFTVTNRIARSL